MSWLFDAAKASWSYLKSFRPIRLELERRSDNVEVTYTNRTSKVQTIKEVVFWVNGRLRPRGEVRRFPDNQPNHGPFDIQAGGTRFASYKIGPGTPNVRVEVKVVGVRRPATAHLG